MRIHRDARNGRRRLLRRIDWLGAVLLAALAGSVAIAAAPRPAAPANGKSSTKAAVAAAEGVATRWLALIDAQRYVPAWDEASSYLHATVAERKWMESVARVRFFAGGLRSRELKSGYETTYLPGAPYGHYVVVYYVSRFEHRPHASETLTLMRDASGAWRVVGYYVQ